jgi:hypothetical protein
MSLFSNGNLAFREFFRNPTIPFFGQIRLILLSFLPEV